MWINSIKKIWLDNLKKINLLLASILCIMLIFSIPVYNDWLNARILAKGYSISDQFQNMGVEQRMLVRFSNSYRVYKNIQKTILSIDSKNPVILLPPLGYIKSGQADGSFELAEPAVFYYFTGIKAVNVGSPDVLRSSWIMCVQNKSIGLRKVPNRKFLDSMIRIFNTYKN
jgi:hypothetical protein